MSRSIGQERWNQWDPSWHGAEAVTPPPIPPPHPHKRKIAAWLLKLARRGRPAGVLTAAEIGVKAGEHAQCLLAGDDALILLLVDRWAPAPADSEYRRNGDPAANASAGQHRAWLIEAQRRLAPWRERVSFYRGESAAAAAAFEGDGATAFDFVFLDADHSYPGRLEDLALWTPLVRPGGIVAGGLLESSFGGDCGQRALLDFLEQQGWSPPLEFGPASTWAFVKPGE